MAQKKHDAAEKPAADKGPQPAIDQPESASSMMDASASIRKLAILFRHMEAAANALESRGSIEQATEEARATLARVRSELDVAQLDLKKVVEETHDTRAKCQESLEQAQALIAAESEKAAALIVTAEQTARQSAAEIIEAANARVSEAESTRVQRLDDMDKQIKGREERYAKLEADISGMEVTRSDLQERISAAKQAARAIVEG